MINVMELFAGVGSLSAQWLKGWRTVCYVERAEYPTRIIKARIRDGLLDDAPIWDDVGTFDGRPWRGFVDVIKGGFPCQPFSNAGKMAAGDDPRDGWPDTIRIIREIRPQFVYLENVPGLLAGSHGYFGRILRELAESGYDAKWRVLSAAELGAPHKRDRLWIVASHADRFRNREQYGFEKAGAHGKRGYFDVADAESGRRQPIWSRQEAGEKAGSAPGGFADGRDDVSYPNGNGCNEVEQQDGRVSQGEGPVCQIAECSSRGEWWKVEPGLGRVANGVAHRVDRLKAIGNGEVPIVAQAAWNLLTEDL